MLDAAFFPPDIQLDLRAPPGGARPNGSNRSQRERRRRKGRVKAGGRRGRRSEADLIHRFDFIVGDEGEQEMNPNLSAMLKGLINLAELR